MTVLFCDLVGSTQLSAVLDPEDLMEVVSAYQAACAAVVGRFDGHIVKYLGDGVLVVFGFPHAHEDDALRAVRTGLGILEAVGQLNERLAAEMAAPLAVRVGIHTGLAIVGEVTPDQNKVDIVGETPNQAARIQGEADPGQVLISDATHRLVAGYFQCEPAGLHELKGLPQPVLLHRVLHESTARSRIDVAAAAGLTPMVGREAERAALARAWEAAKNRHGGAVLLRGEGGIGKSRLALDLAERAARGADAWYTPCQCSPFRTNAPLFPVIEALERVVLGFTPGEPEDSKLAKVEGWAAQHGLDAAVAVPVLAGLLSLPPPAGYPPLSLPPPRRKQVAVGILVQALVHRSDRQPLLVVVEDLHWADPSTIDFLGVLLAAAAGQRMLIVMTCRPEFEPPWATSGHTELTIGRLDPELVERMTAGLAGGKALPAEVRAQIRAKADGVPLFVEELTKTVLESPQLEESDGRFRLVGSPASLAIPASLEGSLLARLDRLPSARVVVQMGSVLGRDFSEEWLHALASAAGGTDPGTVSEGLRDLVAAQILFVGSAPGRTFVFKHALIRDAAYESILHRQRRRYHGHVAAVLQGQFPGVATQQPELLAYHLTEAGQGEAAIGHWQRAGQRAVERSANVEAVAYLRQALGQIARLPEGPDRDTLELAAQTRLRIASTWSHPAALSGLAAREVELSLQVGDTAQRANALWVQWGVNVIGGSIAAALQAAEQMEALAAGHPENAALALHACQLNGSAQLYAGLFEPAQRWLARGSALYDPGAHRDLQFVHGGADLGVSLRACLAISLWGLGRREEATAAMAAAAVTARAIDHPFSHAYLHNYCSWLHHLLGDAARSGAEAEAAIQVCDAHGFTSYGHIGAVLRGSSLAAQGSLDEGIAQMEAALAAIQVLGAQMFRPASLGLLAGGLQRAGRRDEALDALAAALRLADERGERWYEAELHRLRGEILAEQGRPADAEAALRQGLAVARHQSAPAWERRVTESLERRSSWSAEATDCGAGVGPQPGSPHCLHVPQAPGGILASDPSLKWTGGLGLDPPMDGL